MPRAELARLLEDADLPAWAKVLVPTLQAILNGARDAALAGSKRGQEPFFTLSRLVIVSPTSKEVAHPARSTRTGPAGPC